MARVLLFFVDGVGLGDDDASTNPFLSATLPTLHGLLGVDRITRATAPVHGLRASLVAVDATMGVDGTPQSGTGQASLLTGAMPREFPLTVPQKLAENLYVLLNPALPPARGK